MRHLEGKACIVTGAGGGIGCSAAQLIAKLGARVVVNDIDIASAQACAAAIAAGGGEAIADGSDVSDWDQAASLIGACREAFGSVDGLVNNAGLFALATLDEIEKGAFDRMVAVNIIGTANCAVHAAKVMKAQGSGSIINVVSGAHMGIPAMGIYGATKGAAASLTYSWAMELAGTGVRMNAVSPMAGDSGMPAIAHAYYARQGITPPQSTISAKDNAGVFAWLLSDRAHGVNGQIIRIEGEQLSLVAHPAVVLPVLEKEGGWGFEDVDQAFADDLGGRQLPVGITGVSIGGFGSPSRMWAEAAKDKAP